MILQKEVPVYSLPWGAFGFIFLMGSMSMDLALDLSYQAGFVSSYYFLYFSSPVLFQSVLIASVAVAFVPVILRIFINKLGLWDYLTMAVGISCYLIAIFLIFPSGWTVQEMVMHDLEGAEGKVLHLAMYQSDPQMWEYKSEQV